jgi:hypothetical protein
MASSSRGKRAVFDYIEGFYNRIPENEASKADQDQGPQPAGHDTG